MDFYDSRGIELPWQRSVLSCLFVYLFGILYRFQHSTGHIMTGSFVGRGNQYIQLVSRFLYCKQPTIGEQLPTFPHKVQGLNQRCHRWEGSVLPLCHYGPLFNIIKASGIEELIPQGSQLQLSTYCFCYSPT